jgi:hypothetical protein
MLHNVQEYKLFRRPDPPRDAEVCCYDESQAKRATHRRDFARSSLRLSVTNGVAESHRSRVDSHSA